MELIALIAFIALVIYGLEHNRSRTATRPRLYGSSDVQDRDTERISNELHAH